MHFWDNVHLFKYYSVKGPQKCFNSFNCSNQSCTSFQIFVYTRWVKKNGLKFSYIFTDWDCGVILILFFKRQLTLYFKRIPFSISIIKVKIESLITKNNYNMKWYVLNSVQNLSKIYHTLFKLFFNVCVMVSICK